MKSADESSATPSNGGLRISSINQTMLASLSDEVRFEPTCLHPAQGIAVVSASFRKRHSKVSSYFFTDVGVEPSVRENSSANSQATDFLANQFNSGLASPASSKNQASSLKPAISKDDHRTHLKPPREVIKMGDRLFYMLQPPLESLLAGSSMEFPFPPFDFQYEGVGFLFTRYSAILADEMGLGKTMQAITSMRMLLRTGHVKNILLVCPKPLVTNWQREFKAWAPEITVAAVCGSKSERAWHWRHNRSMVKIANYELMIRDEDIITCLLYTSPSPRDRG